MTGPVVPTPMRGAAAALIDTAREFVGIREQMGNRGFHVDFFNAFAFLDRADAWKPYPLGMIGAPWCASFVGLCGRLAIGTRWPVPRTMVDVDKLATWAVAQGVGVPGTTTALPGDLLCVRHGGNYGHVAIVTGSAVTHSKVPTVEGNTNTTGSRNGDGVYELDRRVLHPEDLLVRWVRLL